jgi:hypothetical protein
MAQIIAFPAPAPSPADADLLGVAESAEHQRLLAAMRAHPSNFRSRLRLVPDAAP